MSEVGANDLKFFSESFEIPSESFEVIDNKLSAGLNLKPFQPQNNCLEVGVDTVG